MMEFLFFSTIIVYLLNILLHKLDKSRVKIIRIFESSYNYQGKINDQICIRLINNM